MIGDGMGRDLIALDSASQRVVERALLFTRATHLDANDLMLDPGYKPRGAPPAAAPVAADPGGDPFVLPPNGDATVIDGYAAMPGLDATDVREDSAWEVTFDYKGETRQRVGFGTVAVPGAFAALAMAVERHGHLPWATVLAPAIRYARDGSVHETSMTPELREYPGAMGAMPERYMVGVKPWRIILPGALLRLFRLAF